MTTKLQVGIKAALRALLPIAVAVLGLVQAGVVKHWRDLLNPDAVLAIPSAAGLKGIASGLTAKSISLLP